MCELLKLCFPFTTGQQEKGSFPASPKCLGQKKMSPRIVWKPGFSLFCLPQMKFLPVLKSWGEWLVPGLHRWASHASVPQAAPSLAFVPASPPPDTAAIEKLQEFVLRCQRLFVLTGAGISTESGIPDYRSEGVGLYARSDRRPVQHAEFLRSAAARQKYWARNFVGWPQFSSHQPNAAHRALSSWEQQGKLHWLVTQNVDALHAKAGSLRMTELHGCTHRWRGGRG